VRPCVAGCGGVPHHLRQEVGLVLAGVPPAQQLRRAALRAGGHPRVVARGQQVRPLGQRVLQEGVKLDVPVAGQVRVGRQALGALRHKVLKHVRPVAAHKVDLLQGDPCNQGRHTHSDRSGWERVPGEAAPHLVQDGQ
jgi:hypothetical protein